MRLRTKEEQQAFVDGLKTALETIESNPKHFKRVIQASIDILELPLDDEIATIRSSAAALQKLSELPFCGNCGGPYA